jgi:hypothetical protein
LNEPGADLVSELTEAYAGCFEAWRGRERAVTDAVPECSPPFSE